MSKTYIEVMDTVFLWPWCALFVFLPLLVYFLMPRKESSHFEIALKVPFFNQVSSYSKPHLITKSFLNGVLAVLMWLFLVLSVMRPVWYLDQYETPRQARNIVLVLDVSQSMDAVQFVVDHQQVTRFDLVKEAIRSFLKKRFADNIAFVLFGDEAYTYAPLSYDKKTLQSLLDEVSPGIAGKMTAMGEGLALGVQNTLKIPSENRVVILLSDGYANAGSVSVEEALSLAKRHQVKVYTIAMTSPETQEGFFSPFFHESDVDEKLLSSIAQQTGGRYFKAASQEDLNQVYHIIDQLEETPVADEVTRPRQEIFFIPLLIALILMFFVFIRRGER